MRNEKEYCEKRATELKEEMIQATKECDRVKFSEAYNKAQRYMKRGELKNMMKMFISHMEN